MKAWYELYPCPSRTSGDDLITDVANELGFILGNDLAGNRIPCGRAA